MRNNMCKNVCNVLLKVFFFVFSFFILYAMLLKAVGSYVIHSGQSEYSGISIAIVMLIFGMIIIFALTCQSKNHYCIYYLYPIALFLCALTLRLLIILAMGFDTNQVSDFGLAYTQSQKLNPLDITYYKIFSNWGMYVLYLKLINNIFGNYTIVGIIGNAILSAVSVLLIYYIVILSTQKVTFAIIASSLFNLWPAHLFYTILLSPDFITIFLYLSAILCVCIGHNKFKAHFKKQGLIAYVISGILVGIGNFFKSIAIIYVIALSVVLLLEFIYQHKRSGVKFNSLKGLMKGLLNEEFTSLLLSFVLIFLTVKCGYSVLDHISGTHVNRNPTAHFLYIGLNPFSHGEWSQKTFIYPKIVVKDNFDYNKANNEIMQVLKKEINKYHNLTFKFFDEKLKFAWADNDYLYYPNMTMNLKSTAFVEEKWAEIARPVVQLYYIGLLFFLFIGAIYGFIYKEKNLVFFSMLFIFGFALMLILIEVQPRYKTVVYPFMCIGAGYGFNCMLNTLSFKIRHLFNLSKKLNGDK